MGGKIVVGEREPIGLALRRFGKLLERTGTRWEMRRRQHFTRQTEIRRAKAFRKWDRTRKATRNTSAS
jgi:small subunit ribosomal protein S21